MNQGSGFTFAAGKEGKKKKKSSGSAVTAGALLLAVGEQEIDGWRTMKAEGARGPLPAMAASVYTSTAHMLSCALALRRARATHVAFGVSLSLSLATLVPGLN